MTGVQTIEEMQLYFGMTQLLQRTLQIMLVLHQRALSNGSRKRKKNQCAGGTHIDVV